MPVAEIVNESAEQIRPLLHVKSNLKDFITGNGFVIIAAGSAFGKMVLDLICSIVNDLCMPLVYQLSIRVMPHNIQHASDADLYKDVKKQVHWLGVVRGVITFTVSLMVLYVMSELVFRQIFQQAP